MTQHTGLIDRLRCFDRVSCNEAADALESQAQEIAALKEQVEGLRKDAERYRLLRECGVDSYDACGSHEKLDAECDAAIAAKGGA